MTSRLASPEATSTNTSFGQVSVDLFGDVINVGVKEEKWLGLLLSHVRKY